MFECGIEYSTAVFQVGSNLALFFIFTDLIFKISVVQWFSLTGLAKLSVRF